MDCIDQTIGQRFALYRGDCVRVMRGIPADSVGYSIFSPPFASLYTYSDDPRDMGNCRDDAEFFGQYRYMLSELYRVMMPGRLVSVHCMDLPTSKVRHGVIGLRDFSGDLIRAMEDVWFVLHCRVTIWKDPVTAMQRRCAARSLRWRERPSGRTRTPNGSPTGASAAPAVSRSGSGGVHATTTI